MIDKKKAVPSARGGSGQPPKFLIPSYLILVLCVALVAERPLVLAVYSYHVYS